MCSPPASWSGWVMFYASMCSKYYTKCSFVEQKCTRLYKNITFMFFLYFSCYLPFFFLLLMPNLRQIASHLIACLLLTWLQCKITAMMARFIFFFSSLTWHLAYWTSGGQCVTCCVWAAKFSLGSAVCFVECLYCHEMKKLEWQIKWKILLHYSKRGVTFWGKPMLLTPLSSHCWRIHMLKINC